jgi:hypothetical protein
MKVNLDTIKEKLSHDGDLRGGPGSEDLDDYEVNHEDDLGFYQQGCELLLHELERLEKKREEVHQ